MTKGGKSLVPTTIIEVYVYSMDDVIIVVTNLSAFSVGVSDRQ
jgi:hypothetical protein